MPGTLRTVLLLTAALWASTDLWAGQFQPAVHYPAGQRPYQVIVGRFTHSGNLDVVFADWLSNQLCILLGNGDGSLQKQRCFPAPEPVAIASGDFNEDGNLDLAIVEFGGTGYSYLAILLGSGDGTFRFARTYRLAQGSGAGLAIADFNGDGHLDAVVNNPAIEGGRSGVLLFLSTGEGTFKGPEQYAVGNGPGAIVAGDLNGDHNPDLAVAQFSTGSVAVLLNDGTGHFKKPVSYNAGGGEVVDVKIADLRHDGRNDLVIANASRGMVVILNQGYGTFGKPALYQPTFVNWQAPDACTVADFNLDGKLDVACVANINDPYLFYGKGNGTFGTGIQIKAAINHQGGFGITSGDFNHDKAPDLAIPIQTYGKVAILLNAQ